MQMIYSLLAVPAWLTENAKTIAIAAAAVILLIAFVVGFVKGFSRIGWGALAWAGACAMFFFAEKKFHGVNPILKIGAVSKLDAGVQSFISTLSIALASVLIMLAVCGIFSLIFRPKWRKRRTFSEDYDDEEDEEDLDLDEDEERRMNAARYGGPKIGGLNRFFGAVVAVLNAALVVAAIGCLALVVIDITPLRNGALKAVYENAVMEKIWGFMHAHTLDFLFLGIIAGIAYGNYRMGIVGGFRAVLLTFGYIAAIIVAFWLPFSRIAAEKSWLAFIGKGSDFFLKLIGGAMSEKVAGIVSKALCGAVIAVVLCIAVAIVGWILKFVSKAMSRFAVLRFVDGTLCTVVMLALGVLICGLIGALLYVLEYFGVFKASALFDSASSFTKGMYDVFEVYLKPFLEKIAGYLQ